MEKKKFPIAEIQKQIATHKGLNGWLMSDFRGHNSLAIELLGIPQEMLLSRRFYYWIPKSGLPLKIVHKIESHALEHLPGDQIAYESWKSLDLALSSTLKGQKCIAMEHSPLNAIPVISKLDAGTFEWLQTKKIEVVSSWPIAQYFISRWNEEQFKQHQEASKVLIKAYKSCWKLVKEAIASKEDLFELDLQRHILEILASHDMATCHPPIVAVGVNSALPHYCPTEKKNTKIEPGKLLLIDLWGKKQTPNAPYADITQVAFVGKKPPADMKKVYNVVWQAQATAIEYLQTKLLDNKEVSGCEVDDICRTVIQQAGFGTYFVHRTGHNIHTSLHGLGPNIDNFETHDTRTLMPRTCYSIEPGIYLPKAFGIRLECDIFIQDNLEVKVTGNSPRQLPCIGYSETT